MKTKILAFSSIVCLMAILFSCAGDPKQSKEYKDLEAKMAAMDSLSNSNVNAYNEINKLFISGKTDEFGKYIAENMVDHNPDTMMTKKTGLEGQIEMCKVLQSMYSEMTWTPTQVVSKGDMVFAFGKMGGKNTGDMGPGMKATGKTFNVDFFEAVRMEGGKMQERWGLFDTYSFMTQLGMMDSH